MKKLVIAACLLSIGYFLSIPRALSQAATPPVFTGDAFDDFSGLTGVITINDPVDVATSPMAPGGTISGWDIKNLFLYYDHTSDILYVAFDTYGISSDADGDGDPGKTSNWLLYSAGFDNPDYAGNEYFMLVLDTDNNGSLSADGTDVVIGVDAINDLSGVRSAVLNDYNIAFNPTAAFGATLPNSINVFASPSSTAPDLEFTISDFSSLPGFSFTPGSSFSFGLEAQQGSFDDERIGEELIPYTEINIVSSPRIPTLNQWGIFILFLVLLISGLVVVKTETQKLVN